MISFYTYLFLENHIYFQDYLKHIIVFISLIALLGVSIYYLRHRLETKYRDLSIILLLLVIFLLGLQYSNYEHTEAYTDGTSRMVSFLDSVMANQNINKQEIVVNRQTLMNGMLIGIKDQYYEVHFNNDFSAYTLSPINLLNQNIKLIDK